ncbi:MAG TPA: hypothetical protein VK880_00830, partial [Anaerolineales bacterium]|nr:hypothetical protein [Anaerolineales bacterium]
MQRIKKVSVFLAAGLLIVLTAVFPGELGLNAGWGKSRIVVLILGLVAAILPWLPWKRSGTRAEPLQSDLF